MKTFIFLWLFLVSTTLQASSQSVLEIIKLGHPTLRQVAQEVHYADVRDEAFQRLIDDMIETMGKSNGVGLAAPQVNQSLRVFVMKSWPNVPLTVVINPKIEYLEEFGTKNSTEGCLSIPGKTLTVKRYQRIRLSYFNRQGDYRTEEVSGFKAIIAQHEYDHLNGVLIVDLVRELMSRINFADYANAPLM
jgi:peptide deformylase